MRFNSNLLYFFETQDVFEDLFSGNQVIVWILDQRSPYFGRSHDSIISIPDTKKSGKQMNPDLGQNSDIYCTFFRWSKSGSSVSSLPNGWKITARTWTTSTACSSSGARANRPLFHPQQAVPSPPPLQTFTCQQNRKCQHPFPASRPFPVASPSVCPTVIRSRGTCVTWAVTRLKSFWVESLPELFWSGHQVTGITLSPSSAPAESAIAGSFRYKRREITMSISLKWVHDSKCIAP